MTAATEDAVTPEAPDTQAASAAAQPGDAPASDAASAAQGATKAQFEDLTPEAGTPADEVELDVILDVPVTLSLEVGRTKITIRDLLRLNQGSVVELDRPADEPMDVRVNGTLIARAEIVVVDEMFGIRLIDVVSPSERIRKLN